MVMDSVDCFITEKALANAAVVERFVLSQILAYGRRN